MAALFPDSPCRYVQPCTHVQTCMNTARMSVCGNAHKYRCIGTCVHICMREQTCTRVSVRGQLRVGMHTCVWTRAHMRRHFRYTQLPMGALWC